MHSLFYINPELSHYNFHTLEVVSRYRDQQIQVGENYSELFNLQILMFKHTFCSKCRDLIG